MGAKLLRRGSATQARGVCSGDGSRPSTRTDSPWTWCRKIRRTCRGAPWRRSAPVPPPSAPSRPSPPSERPPRGRCAPVRRAPMSSPRRGAGSNCARRLSPGGDGGPSGMGSNASQRVVPQHVPRQPGGGIARTDRRCLYSPAHSPPPVVMGRVAAQRAPRLRAPPRTPRAALRRSLSARPVPGPRRSSPLAGNARARRGTAGHGGAREVSPAVIARAREALPRAGRGVTRRDALVQNRTATVSPRCPDSSRLVPLARPRVSTPCASRVRAAAQSFGARDRTETDRNGPRGGPCAAGGVRWSERLPTVPAF